MFRFGRELAFLIAGILTSIVAFVVVLVGFVTGVATIVVWVGLPVLVATLLCARWFADLERAACDATSETALPAHAYRARPHWWSALADPQAWRDVLHAIVGFPVLLTTGLVGLSWIVGTLSLISYPLWEWSLPRGDVSGLYGLVTGDNSRLGDIAVNILLGLVALVATPFVIRAMAVTRRAFAWALLTNPGAVMRARAEAAEASRDASTQAESHTLSMIERSIHDGPQQRLVRLTMDLQAAQRRMADDPTTAAGHLDEAVLQSREVLAELRAVSRGIAPPVLSERGLVAAAVAAASRCPIDTVVDTDVPTTRRYDDEVEAAAYFVVAEALTNVAKHSGASQAAVSIVEDGGLLVIRIEDDGTGGAHLGKGHGLTGLEARVTGVRGRMHIASPAGGPTVVTAMVPRGAA